ncbi:glyoxalase superfamily protein [Acaryochloris marina]|uniref:Glyoxalase family protein, putative n=1 Tax=Acaryochloris marina (strain MBIC 11017) TaxID=329726 RepID=A8ZPX3_ACAM1|nr:glyoxalase superfamily protein [Acaryochloris marina]ABW33005.1 glyoxalase family protein, putative [Acaryochloris marina MBIC11017]BDM83207.1 hypothetical protein AM10699_60680 [Acaryochloris marina MBIC10699]
MPIEKDKWYTRPVFSVASVQKSLSYYRDLLGFTQSWKYDEAGEVLVAQVSRGDFELILASNLDRKGQGRVFISLTESETSRFKEMIESMHITYEEIYWGYPSIKLQDPDGNELIFPQETED